MNTLVLLRSLVRGCAIGLLVSLACVPLALGINYLWVRSDPGPLVAELARSMERPNGILGPSSERFNDCLLPLIALLDRGTTRELTVSAQRVYSRVKPQQPCRALEQRVANGRVDEREFATVFYHQYWNGHRVVIGSLFPRLGVSGYRRLLLVLTYGLLALTGCAASWRLQRSKASAAAASGAVSPAEDERHFAVAVLISCLVFAFSFDLQQRASSMASGITNLPVFALWLLVALSNPLRWSKTARALAAATLGCWIAYFSVFTGSILLGGLSLMALAAIAPATEPRLRHERAETVVLFASAFCSAVLSFLLLHVLVADLVFDQDIFAFFFDQLAYRIDGSGRSTMADSLNPLYGDHEVSLSRLIERMAPNLSVLGGGSLLLGRLLFGASCLVLAIGLPTLAVRRRRLRDPWRLVALSASILAVPLWYGLFLEHSQVHVRFMARFLAWPIAGAGFVSLYFLPPFRRLLWQDSEERPS